MGAETIFLWLWIHTDHATNPGSAQVNLCELFNTSEVKFLAWTTQILCNLLRCYDNQRRKPVWRLQDNDWLNKCNLLSSFIHVIRLCSSLKILMSCRTSWYQILTYQWLLDPPMTYGGSVHPPTIAQPTGSLQQYHRCWLPQPKEHWTSIIKKLIQLKLHPCMRPSWLYPLAVISLPSLELGPSQPPLAPSTHLTQFQADWTPGSFHKTHLLSCIMGLCIISALPSAWNLFYSIFDQNPITSIHLIDIYVYF